MRAHPPEEHDVLSPTTGPTRGSPHVGGAELYDVPLTDNRAHTWGPACRRRNVSRACHGEGKLPSALDFAVGGISSPVHASKSFSPPFFSPRHIFLDRHQTGVVFGSASCLRRAPRGKKRFFRDSNFFIATVTSDV